jgi:AraC-like DNA-binding protein
MIYLTDRYGTDFLHALIENSDDYTQKFTQTIESNKLNRLTLKELAFLCNMSVSGFKRQFKKYYNESPIKWFQNKRLEHAYYLVHQKQKTSSEIYLEIGYENLSSFIKAYKTKFGTTPKQHQKN